MGQEVARINARGYYDGLGGGTYIGGSPHFAVLSLILTCFFKAFRRS